MKKTTLKKIRSIITFAIGIGVFLSWGIAYAGTPRPDPMTWETPPYTTSSASISMAATTAYMDNTPPEPNPSQWQVEHADI